MTSSHLPLLPMDLQEFLSWYRELAKLKIFWARPFKEVKVLSSSEGRTLILIRWVLRGEGRIAALCISQDFMEAMGILREVRSDYRVMIVPEDRAPPLPPGVRSSSILYFWDPVGRTLEPNYEVEVRSLDSWGQAELRIFQQIQRRSWGFFIPPRVGDHVVMLALLDEIPVGLAYLNRRNFNLDYGVHVVRELWRRRIGTRILKESMNIARKLEGRFISVIRVLRSLRGTTSDRRAISFYRANRPMVKLIIYRLAEDL